MISLALLLTSLSFPPFFIQQEYSQQDLYLLLLSTILQASRTAGNAYKPSRLGHHRCHSQGKINYPFAE